MERRDIQRLAAGGIDPERFRDLAVHGEDLLVERKAQIPAPEKLGAEVASMANMLGGWILLGVEDRSHKLVGFELKKGTDPQSYIGQLLRNAVDPVPPFLADTLEVDEVTVGFIRVFQASVLVLVRGTGAVYSRDDGGKVPIRDHRELLGLARAGAAAEDAARRRPDENTLSGQVLRASGRGVDPPYRDTSLRVIVRAAPLTVTPQFAEWPITGGPAACREVSENLARACGAPRKFTTELEPRGRAVVARAARFAADPRRGHVAVAFADCVGVVGVAMEKPIAAGKSTNLLRSEYLRPAINGVAELLIAAEALGDSVVDMYLGHLRDELMLTDPEGRGDGRLPPVVHCGSAIVNTPADDEDRHQLGQRWEREVARESGIPAWESGPDEG